MIDLIDRQALLAAYDAEHIGPPGRARELIENAPAVEFPLLSCEGIKMFRGTMRITPKSPDFPPEEIYGDWLYKFEYDIWYTKGRSFPASICERVG